MGKFLRYGVYVAASIQLIFVLLLLPDMDGGDVIFALSLLLLPVLSIAALYWGPTLEERRLQRQVNKTQLEQELDNLDKK